MFVCLTCLENQANLTQMAQEWALAAKGWGADINLIPRQDEGVADNDFKAGKCDGVF